MNIIVPKRDKISEAERAKRQAAVAHARASVRLEGFMVSAAAEEISSRYVNGEFDSNEMMNRLLALHKQ